MASLPETHTLTIDTEIDRAALDRQVQEVREALAEAATAPVLTKSPQSGMETMKRQVDDMHEHGVSLDTTGNVYSTLQVQQLPPTITRRVKLDHTLKDGWRVSELSVTIESTWGEDEVEGEFARSLADLFAEGDHVAQERNAARETSHAGA